MRLIWVSRFLIMGPCMGFFLDYNTTIEIKGKILFDREVGKLPSPSCMKIKFQDVSFADASSTMVKNITIDLSGMTLGSDYDYTMTSFRPEKAYNSYSMSVVMNVGWCADLENNDEWIRKGDYNNDFTHYIDMRQNKTEFNIDIKAMCYGR